MTRLVHDNQHSQHSKKHKKQPETRKQVQMAQDPRVKTERNRVDKQKSLNKKKREDVNKKPIAALCEAM